VYDAELITRFHKVQLSIPLGPGPLLPPPFLSLLSFHYLGNYWSSYNVLMFKTKYPYYKYIFDAFFLIPLIIQKITMIFFKLNIANIKKAFQNSRLMY